MTGRSQPVVSPHLACFEVWGLVIGRREGRFVYSGFVDPRIGDVLRCAHGVPADVAARTYTCTRDGVEEDSHWG